MRGEPHRLIVRDPELGYKSTSAEFDFRGLTSAELDFRGSGLPWFDDPELAVVEQTDNSSAERHFSSALAHVPANVLPVTESSPPCELERCDA